MVYKMLCRNCSLRTWTHKFRVLAASNTEKIELAAVSTQGYETLTHPQKFTSRFNKNILNKIAKKDAYRDE